MADAVLQQSIYANCMSIQVFSQTAGEGFQVVKAGIMDQDQQKRDLTLTLPQKSPGSNLPIKNCITNWAKP